MYGTSIFYLETNHLIVSPYTGEMTKAEARRYEREHSVKDSYYFECVK